MKLQIITNGTFDEEKALLCIDSNDVICSGDYYHDKIDALIEGFLRGLKYAKVDFLDPETITVNPDNPLFDICGFYNDSYETDLDEDESGEKCENEDDIQEEINEIGYVNENINSIVSQEDEKPKYRFRIYSENTEGFCGTILEALEKVRNVEGDLYLVDNQEEKLVYSCLGLENHNNNQLLEKFGVYIDDNNSIQKIKK